MSKEKAPVMPTGENAVVVMRKTEKSAGGVFLPETAMGDENTAHLCAVGPDSKLQEAVGKSVKLAYGWEKRGAVDHGGKQYLIVDSESIVAVLG